MFVIEGPDGSGKTTLVKHLAKTHGLTVQQKLVTPDQEMTMSPTRWTEASIDRGWGPWLYDRHTLISEFMYLSGPGARPRDGLDDPAWLRTALMRFWDVPPVVIFCLPPFEEVWKNCQRDEANKRLFPHREHLGRVYWRYFYETCGNPRIYTYDYTEEKALHYVDMYVSAMLLRKV